MLEQPDLVVPPKLPAPLLKAFRSLVRGLLLAVRSSYGLGARYSTAIEPMRSIRSPSRLTCCTIRTR